jgi:hypothetical protein
MDWLSVFTHYYALSSSNRFGESDTVILSFVPLTPDVREENGLPTGYFLTQNFPNPFNPVTTIRYGIPQLSFVRLEVFDALGRKVITLVEGNRERGSYRAEWNARGEASGIYYYRLSAGGFIETKSLVLLK